MCGSTSALMKAVPFWSLQVALKGDNPLTTRSAATTKGRRLAVATRGVVLAPRWAGFAWARAGGTRERLTARQAAAAAHCIAPNRASDVFELRNDRSSRIWAYKTTGRFRYMALIDRVKNILLTPKTEWEVIDGESTPTQDLIVKYVLPLAGVAALASFIGWCVVGQSLPFVGTWRMSIGWGLGLAVWHVIGAVIAVFVLGFIIDALAPTFGAQKNSAQAFKVAVYSYTPAWVAGILNILPMLAPLAILAGLYAIYLLYLGLPRVMKNPAEKSAGYTAVTVIAAIVLSVIISVIGGLVAAPAMMATGAMGSGSPMGSAR